MEYYITAPLAASRAASLEARPLPEFTTEAQHKLKELTTIYNMLAEKKRTPNFTIDSITYTSDSNMLDMKATIPEHDWADHPKTITKIQRLDLLDMQSEAEYYRQRLEYLEKHMAAIVEDGISDYSGDVIWDNYHVDDMLAELEIEVK